MDFSIAFRSSSLPLQLYLWRFFTIYMQLLSLHACYMPYPSRPIFCVATKDLLKSEEVWYILWHKTSSCFAAINHHHRHGLGRTWSVPSSWRVYWFLHLNCGRLVELYVKITLKHTLLLWFAVTSTTSARRADIAWWTSQDATSAKPVASTSVYRSTWRRTVSQQKKSLYCTIIPCVKTL
jgi:hypothetical protein